MYSTCIFCHESLGHNDVVEHCPVGRRLAFDSVKGRLWIVCRHCSRWNLTPIEERWEAIEECERIFRAERLRAQTDNIGVAKVREGLGLVRIGQPLRPEFAAWRYGDVLRQRLRARVVVLAAASAVGAAGLAIANATGVLHSVGIMIAAFPPLAAWPTMMLVGAVRVYRNQLRIIKVPRIGGTPYELARVHIDETDLEPDGAPGSWQLNLRHIGGEALLTGDPARRALSVLLTRVNGMGASIPTARSAATLIGVGGGAEGYLASMAKQSLKRRGDFRERRRIFRRTGIGDSTGWPGRTVPPVNAGALTHFGIEERLALEMAVHEEDERLALELDLAPLERAWREAEEIAGIVDGELTPVPQAKRP